MKKKFVFIVVLILLLTVSFSGCGKTKIDVEQLFLVTEMGGNGYGSVEVKISDYYVDSLVNPYASGSKSKVDGNTLLSRNLYFDSLQFQITSPNQNLSNGDIVEITIIDNEQLAKNAKVKLSKNVYQYQVSFLPELKVLYPFNDYEVTFEGDNGEGYINIWGYVKAENGNYLMTSVECSAYDSAGNKLGNDRYSYEKHEGYSDEIQGLSNGDTVTLKLDYDKMSLAQEGYVMNQDEQIYTVSGLEEYEIVDEDLLFDSFDYEIHGASPNASMSVENKLPDDLYGYFYYTVYPDYDLEIGDKITITVTADQSRLKEAGKTLPGGSSSYEYELTEDILPQYLSSLDDISDTAKQYLEADLSDYILKIQADYKSSYEDVKGDYTRLDSVTVGDLEKVILLYPKSSMMDQIYDIYNNLIFIYEARVVTDDYWEKSETYDLYIALVYSNIINYPGSGLYVDSSKLFHVSMLDTLSNIEDEVVNQYRDKYVVSEIGASDF
ncbi:MAG TPA: hypothetical protein GXZ43_04160 [Clostridiaceae bacterium]|nr:hypothetical protein [Clostridiaceae bacterium]